jgi:hypothetical protein
VQYTTDAERATTALRKDMMARFAETHQIIQLQKSAESAPPLEADPLFAIISKTVAENRAAIQKLMDTATPTEFWTAIRDWPSQVASLKTEVAALRAALPAPPAPTMPIHTGFLPLTTPVTGGFSIAPSQGTGSSPAAGGAAPEDRGAYQPVASHHPHPSNHSHNPQPSKRARTDNNSQTSDVLFGPVSFGTSGKSEVAVETTIDPQRHHRPHRNTLSMIAGGEGVGPFS